MNFDLNVGKQTSGIATLYLECLYTGPQKQPQVPQPVAVVAAISAVPSAEVKSDRRDYEESKHATIAIDGNVIARVEAEKFIQNCHQPGPGSLAFAIPEKVLASAVGDGVISLKFDFNLPLGGEQTFQISGRLEYSISGTPLSTDNKLATNRNFMSRRAETLASSGPDLSEFHGRLSGASSGGGGQSNFTGGPSSAGPSAPVNRLGGYSLLGDGTVSGVRSYPGVRRGQQHFFDFLGSGTESGGRLSFATSLAKVLSAREAQRHGLVPSGLGLDSDGSPSGLVNLPFNVWTQAQISYFNDDLGGGDRDGHTGLAFLGADVVLSSSLLVGVLVQYDWMEESSSVLNTEADGQGWMAGPYISARLTDRIFLDLRAAWGRSNNDVEQVGLSQDSFDTSRALVSGSLSGSWQIGAFRLTPSIAVNYFREKQHAYTDSLNVPIPEQTVKLGRAKFGGELGYRFRSVGGTIIEPHVKLNGLWDFDKDETATVGGLIVSTQEFRGKVEGGIRMTSPDGYSVRAGGAYDGIGDDDLDVYEGQVFVIVPFD